MEHCEAVVVLRSDDDVLHPCVMIEAHPLVRVEFYRIKLLRKLFVLRYGNPRVIHYPLAKARNGFTFPLTGRHRVESPMNHHPETRLAPPLETTVSLLLGSDSGLHRSLRFLRLSK